MALIIFITITIFWTLSWFIYTAIIIMTIITLINIIMFCVHVNVQMVDKLQVNKLPL